MSEIKKENPWKYSESPELHNIFDQMVKIQEKELKLKEKEAKLAGLEEGGLKFRDLKKIKNPPSLDLHSYTETYISGFGRKKRDPAVVKEEILKMAERLKAEIAEVEAENIPIKAHNEEVVRVVTSLMKSLGVNDSYSTYDYPSSRSRTKKETKHYAGYISDLNRARPTTNVDTIKNQLQVLLAGMERWALEEAKSRKEEAEQKNKEEMAKLLEKPQMIVDLKTAGVDLLQMIKDKGVNSVKGVINDAVNKAIELTLAKNKYLHLGYYLLKNRNDWNDGCSYAETGLGRFYVEDKTDEEIHADISSYINDWDGDGRVFRDCKWNYSVLFGMVGNKELVELLQNLMQYED